MPEGKQPNCAVCGKFMRWIGNSIYGSGWRCRDVFYDDYSGAWEHA